MLAGIWISAITGAPFLLGTVPVILLVALDLRSPLRRAGDTSGLSVLRQVSEEKSLMGDKVRMELTIVNSGPKIDRISLRDLTPPRSTVTKGSTLLLCSLEHGGKATLRYEVLFRDPGDYLFESLQVRIESMFGLAERAFILKSELKVRVYPRHLVKNVAIGPAKAFGWSGTTPSRYRGGRLDFMNIRGYVAGDPLRDVNWRASGRLGKTLVNEWRVERGLDCVIIVDLSAEGLPRVEEWSGRGAVVTSTYELASSLLSSGNRVGLLVMGSLLDKVKPGFGPKQLGIMVDTLVGASEGRLWSMKYAERYLELFFSRQYGMREGTLFFVSASPSAELIDSVDSLARKGFVCNTVVVDALDEEGAALAEFHVLKQKEVEFGVRYARADSDFIRSRLAAVSDVYVWVPGAGFANAGGGGRRPGMRIAGWKGTGRRTYKGLMAASTTKTGGSEERK